MKSSSERAAGARRDFTPAARWLRLARPAQRGRYGAKLVPLLVPIAGILAISAASAAEISVRQVQQNKFEFVLTNPTLLSESEARAHIANAAANVCQGLTPVLGTYNFEASETIGGDPPLNEPNSYRFTQQVSCVHGTKVPLDQLRPTPLTPEESYHVQEDIRLRSEAYFRSIAEQRLDDAYVQVSARGMNVDEVTWKSEKRSFQMAAGEPLQISIVRVTVYDNPNDAPEPGLYVAADFSNAYTNIPIHCGYLMWFRPIGGSFIVTREETGYVTAEQLKSIPIAHLPEIKQKLRCVAP